MSKRATWVVGGQEYYSFPNFRKALQAFLKQSDAQEVLASSPDMQDSIIRAYFSHYHWDPSSSPPPDRSDVTSAIVAKHPKWGSSCFALVLRGGAEHVTFSVKKLKATPPHLQTSIAHRRISSTGQRRKNLHDALRAAVEPTIRAWAKDNEPPLHCPISGLELGPLSYLSDPQLRYDDCAPTIDHLDPPFRERVISFLELASLRVEDVHLTKNPDTGVWEMADAAQERMWIDHHGSSGLRWISLKANRLINRLSQQL